MTSPNFLTSSLFVALGGGVGSWLRYSVGRLWIAAIGPVAAGTFPWATLTVNVVGSFLMGVLAGSMARYGNGGESWRLLLGVGMLGGFTTFSAFSLEIAGFIERSALATAAVYTLVSLVAGVAGLFLGLALMRATA